MLGLHAGARAQGGLDVAIAEAESLYAAGRFEDPAPLLFYSTEGATEEQATAVFRLLALFYLQDGALPEATVTVVRLVHRAPGYQPDPVADPPEYVGLVNHIQELLLYDAEAAETCAPEMAEANARYVEGSFEQAAQVLSECTNQRFMYLADEEKESALRLLILLYLRMGDVTHARNTGAVLLRVLPDYSPDPVRDPPGYVALIGALKFARSGGAR